MDPHGQGVSGPPEKTVQPLTREALEEFKKIQGRAGIVYISRIPPGMHPSKIQHLMGSHGEVGRVYLQQEDLKLEFKDKVAQQVAEMLNAQPIRGERGTRWHDDVWTMKYFPRFKWNMLTEQVASFITHEAPVHAAKFRVELSRSKQEQQEYLHHVELAHVLEKRAEKKREKGEELQFKPLSDRAITRKKAHEVVKNENPLRNNWKMYF
ncbi:hypothetical protein C0995_007007 [Termitomyces sp. Mi166|nr:hypothetical protein C0995_007007 [Termitomyces sp. Mi166\